MKAFLSSNANPVSRIDAAKMDHRRVVSPLNGGPDCLDLGLNRYGAGGEFKGPYAYNREEFCYISEGQTEADNSGIRVRSSPGTFMWRPRGVASNWLRGVEDVVNICAFSPARTDAISHRLSEEEMQQRISVEAEPRRPLRVHVSMVPVTEFPNVQSQDGLTYRSIFSKANGSTLVDVDHTIIESGTELKLPPTDRHEIWWIEKGHIQVGVQQSKFSVVTHDCLVRVPSDPDCIVSAVSTSVIVRFRADAGAGLQDLPGSGLPPGQH